MGLTLLAVITAALLLPGIVAARCFYQASRTAELRPSIPPLSSTDGIALIGVFSVVVHLCFSVGLNVIASLEPVFDFPLADPYRVFTTDGLKLDGHRDALSFFLGLTWLCALAIPVGLGGGRLLMHLGDKSIFYGALANIITAGREEGRFITAYVVTKLRHERRAIGYQGTVVSMARDGEGFPTGLVLKAASIFYLDFSGDEPARHEQPGLIDWIALSGAEWENVAFQVFEYEPEATEQMEAATKILTVRNLLLLATAHVIAGLSGVRRRR